MGEAGIDIRDVPAAVREAVGRDIIERDRSLNDAVGEILARRFMIPWTSSGYPHTGASAESDQWLLRVPSELRDTIRDLARRTGYTQRGLILNTLEQHYGLPPSSPRKRVKRIDPTIVAQARERHANGTGESIRSLAREFGVKKETLAREIRA